MFPARRQRSRRWAAALLLGYLGLQASGLAHSVVVRHVLCVQHGEEVEVHDPLLPAPPETPLQGTIAGHPACPFDGAHGHTDHHCLVAQQGRLDAPLTAPGPWVHCVASVAERTQPGLVPVASPWRPLVVAPKTSPPA